MSASFLLSLLVSAAVITKAPNAPEVDLSTMVHFKSASFEMGIGDLTPGPYGDGWYIDQQPLQTLSIEAFYLDRHEVRVSDFARFLTYAAGDYHFRDDQPIERVDGGYLARAGAEAQPMRLVSWSAARDYCLWAGKRLVREAEFEYAIRGDSGRTWPWLEGGVTCGRANHFTGSSRCQQGVVDVMSFPEGDSPEGVSDLVGNVAEWTEDDYAPYAISSPSAIVPTYDFKVVRGGGFINWSKR